MGQMPKRIVVDPKRYESGPRRPPLLRLPYQIRLSGDRLITDPGLWTAVDAQLQRDPSKKRELLRELRTMESEEAARILLTKGPTKAPAPAYPLLAGSDVLGYGIKPFGRLLDHSTTTYPLFRLPAQWTDVRIGDETFSIQKGMSTTAGGGLETNQAWSSTIGEAFSALTVDVEAEADFVLFGGEASMRYSEEMSSHWNFYYYSLVARLALRNVQFESTPGVLRDHLRDEVRAALDAAVMGAMSSKQNAWNFFNLYGTHYIEKVVTGAQVLSNYSFEKKYFASQSELEASAGAYLFGGSVETSVSAASGYENLQQSMRSYTSILGPVRGLSADGTHLDLEVWVDAARTYNVPVAWRLMSVCELAKPVRTGNSALDVRRSLQFAAFKKAWWEYCEAHDIEFVPDGRAIVGLNVGIDPDDAKARQKAANRDGVVYELVPVDEAPMDFNLKKEFGSHVYLGQLLGDTNPITDLTAVEGEGMPTPDGYVRTEGNFNAYDASSMSALDEAFYGEMWLPPVFLCYSTSQEIDAPIRRLNVLYADQEMTAEAIWKATQYHAVLNKATGKPQDFNAGKTGWFIYLLYSRQV